MNGIAPAQTILDFTFTLPAAEPLPAPVQSVGRVCLYCGKAIRSSHGNTKFCTGDTCKSKHWYRSNKKKINARNLAYYRSNKERFRQYSKSYSLTEKGKESARRKQKKHAPKKNAKYRQQLHDLRMAIYDKHGGRFCTGCGESRLHCLTIEHVHGGGNRHRKRVKNALAYLKEIYAAPVGVYTNLCMNCQFISRHALMKKNAARISPSSMNQSPMKKD